MNIEIVLKLGSVGHATTGEIYREPYSSSSEVVVTDVNVSIGHNSRFQLESGKYRYRFNTSGGSGEYTIAVKNRDNNDLELASDAFSVLNDSLSFEVP